MTLGRASAFVLMLIVAAGLFAQSAEPAGEYGRVSGGTLELTTKHSRPFSGSLSLSTSQSSELPFGASRGTGYGATLGGTLIADRLWFFAAAENQPSIASRYGATPTSALDTKMSAQLGERQSLIASFAAARGERPATGAVFDTSIPSSFLSLHYTAVVSDSMFFTGSFSQLRRSDEK
ncbi:MAG: hypothetical protein JJE51_11860 [Thermoanaerobaculia bacterium]|nr:hypothetical protein [Thermoanaerobaculia bacterium]